LISKHLKEPPITGDDPYTAVSSDCVAFHDDSAPLSNPIPDFDMVSVIADELPLAPTEYNPVATVVARLNQRGAPAKVESFNPPKG